MEIRECRHCGADISHKQKNAIYCDRVCKARGTAAQNPKRAEQWRRNRIMKAYGIKQDDYNYMLVMQSDRCAICLTDEKPGRGYWHIDHDHETGKVRGLLCNSCNRGMGLLGDDPLNLASATKYLENTHA